MSQESKDLQETEQESKDFQETKQESKNLQETEQDLIKKDGVLLAQNYTLKEEKKCENWLCFLKYDGMRCIWDPKTKSPYSRLGSKWNFPKYFTEDFPDITMDGEMWCGPNQFKKCSIVKKKVPNEAEWKASGIKYIVFDAIYLKGNLVERLAQLKILCKDCKNIQVADYWISKNSEQVFEDLDRAQNDNHEGLMLRNPTSLYERRRSRDLLKVKSFSESEAEIIGYQQGTGRLADFDKYIGGYEVRSIKSGSAEKDLIPEGIVFSTGSGMTDMDRINRLPIGTIITVKYFEIDSKSKIPRFPIFKGIRIDAAKIV